MAEHLEIHRLVVQIGHAPPVYDPGGATWLVRGRDDADAFRAVEALARERGAAQIVVPDGQADVLVPLGYAACSDFWRGTVSAAAHREPRLAQAIRSADASDLPALLDLSQARRAAYELVQPVFWRPSVDARAKQEAWFTHLLALDHVRALCLPGAFLIAMHRDGCWLIDDFCVQTPDMWMTEGTRMVASLDGLVEVVCACHDAPKQALMRALGLRVERTWFQRTLTAPECSME